ncbi:MAG: hypothetical protein U0872_00650 [Planctomycetaceae bacterium]
MDGRADRAGEEVKLSTKLMPKNAGDYHATVTVTGPAGSVANVDADLRVRLGFRRWLSILAATHV